MPFAAVLYSNTCAYVPTPDGCVKRARAGVIFLISADVFWASLTHRRVFTAARQPRVVVSCSKCPRSPVPCLCFMRWGWETDLINNRFVLCLIFLSSASLHWNHLMPWDRVSPSFLSISLQDVQIRRQSDELVTSVRLVADPVAGSMLETNFRLC